MCIGEAIVYMCVGEYSRVMSSSLCMCVVSGNSGRRRKKKGGDSLGGEEGKVWGGGKREEKEKGACLFTVYCDMCIMCVLGGWACVLM